MKKRTGRMIDAAVTAARGEFLELPSFPCRGIKEGTEEPVFLDDEGTLPIPSFTTQADPIEDLCECGAPLSELRCLEHVNAPDAGVALDPAEIRALDRI